MKTSKPTRSRRAATVLAVALVALIGIVDYRTGRDLVLSAFYLVPICWATWQVGRPVGLFVSLLSAAVWLAGDYFSGYNYPDAAIPIWNALMLLAMFLPAVYFLSAFQRAHLHLEETVTIRTLALQREMEERRRAEGAKIQAERLAMVGMMAAQVAHEVRNPLGAITLTLDLVDNEMSRISAATGYPIEEGAELVGELREEVLRIDRVIRDYLALARPRKASLEPLELNDLIRRKLSLLRGSFAESSVELKTDLDPHPILIKADGDQLWQAILNLVRNSLEAMPEGGLLMVGTTLGENSACIRLTDTGCGMTPGQKEQLFVPFATSKANGNGLGLVLVNQILNEHLGQIECLSAPGQGATFVITLPLDSESAAREIPERNLQPLQTKIS